MTPMRSPGSTALATMPFATALTSSRNCWAVTSTQADPRGTDRATWLGFFVAFSMMWSTRLPVVGVGTTAGTENSVRMLSP